MQSIKNPILTGFNPDPSLISVGKDYYIATSTFEWFPGISIYHSTDLANWELIGAALTDEESMDLEGIDTGCGIWAPSLTYNDGIYYIIYTIVYTDRSRFKDTHNFMITATDIRGPWSKPIFLNCSGFDPSLFHDEDGRKWLINMTMDQRMENPRFAGIEMQELDIAANRLTGKTYKIFSGSAIGTTEGPNITKHNGYYYLVCAEGGTGEGHCVTIARAKQLTGPYEIDPQNPMLASRHNKTYPIQRAGHGQLFQDDKQNWYMVHLCSRPLDGYSILGRETAVQNVVYTADGWFRLANAEDSLPQESFSVTKVVVDNSKGEFQDNFQSIELKKEWLTLRKSAATNGISLSECVDGARIYGGNSLSSKYKQGLMAIRQKDMCCEVVTQMRFKPNNYRHMAGLVCYYNYDNYYYLHVTRDEKIGNYLVITTCENGVLSDSMKCKVSGDSYYLKATIRGTQLRFSYAGEDKIFHGLEEECNMRILSDEHVRGNGFTGAMVGVCCQDLQGDGIYADFTSFHYKKI